VLAVLVPLAGCGDDALSAGPYRQRLDAAREALASEVAQLPQTVRDEHLDTEAAADGCAEGQRRAAAGIEG
jgi:hypothetical protein